MKQSNLVTIILLCLIIFSGVGYLFTQLASSESTDSTVNDSSLPRNIGRGLIGSFPDTDFSKFNLDDFSSVVSGGVAKDGIPALIYPEFTTISETLVEDEVEGVFIEINGDQKFYPFNILVWHEIVNDSVGGQEVAVTFCPLCGSSIVFDTVVGGQKRSFGVSGFLRESNMIMFDRTNESLWQQSTGEAFAGTDTGEVLKLIDFERVSFAVVKEKYPDAKILSEDTGFPRDYRVYPYGDYEANDRLYSEVSNQDETFDLKELFYIVSVDGKSTAIRYSELPRDQKVSEVVGGVTLEITNIDGSPQVIVDGKVLPGYFEMWFSWVAWHADDGQVVEPKL